MIYARVRHTDWTVFWITAVFTALVYLSQKYDGDWGSLEDYLFAFAAGAIAPTVVNWAILPLARSYGLPTKKVTPDSASPSAQLGLA
jgi:hypothetical protein